MINPMSMFFDQPQQTQNPLFMLGQDAYNVTSPWMV